MQNAGGQAVGWIEVAPIVVSALGGGGIAAWITDHLRRRDERRNYWKRERQGVYAQAMEHVHEIEHASGEACTKLGREDPADVDVLRSAIEDVKKNAFELRKLNATIALLANEDTRTAVDSFRTASQSFYVKARMASIESTAEEVDEVRKILVAQGAAMQSAFRKEIGVEQ